ncbi:rod shape-determining protein RodA [Neolewinella persica]|uniref:rod shape-determining protein RodA n=1 Tax=Neolewinella persica TaxID=70998 RepID=UPI0003662AEB|nr:rod shape-determining protein RodA [Neolewinella persica]
MALSVKKLKNDLPTVVLYIFLVVAGMLMLYSVDRPPEGYDGDLMAILASPMGKQFIWLLLSLAAWFVIHHLIDRDLWVVGSYPIYGATVLLLVLVLIFGKEINNARSWFSLFGFTFQPSELAKFGTALAMAAFLSQWSEKLNNLGAIGSGLLIMGLPAVFIVLQPDPGSALVFASFIMVMYREGLSPLIVIFGGFSATMFLLGILQPTSVLAGGLLGLLLIIMALNVPKGLKWWMAGTLVVLAAAGYLFYIGTGWPVLVGLGVLFAGAAVYHLIKRNGQLVLLSATALAWGILIAFAANFMFNNVLRPHQKDRILAWLKPEGLSERGALYNITQSKLAIAAGGVSGKGLGQGTITKYDYVPEQETDFIFSAVGEAEGFMGSMAIILAFLALLWRISVIAERQKRTFVRAYAYGVAGIIFIHMLVNIGMTMGVMPVIGIPLPFLSKGGSSLLSFTIMIAVLLKLDRHRVDV